MTLAARLSTASNLGLLDPTPQTSFTFSKIVDNLLFSLFFSNQAPKNILSDDRNRMEDVRWLIIFGNFGVTQVQALVIGFSSGCWSWILGGYKGGLANLALICSCGIICSAVSMFLLSAFMIWMIVLCRSFKVDPDNMGLLMIYTEFFL
jgi:cation transporter-like permease